MVKKISTVFHATLNKNTEKAGAWIAEYSIRYDGVEEPIKNEFSAWANASAGKRWLKEMVQANTPRKSIKMVEFGDRKDAKGKPATFAGELAYKVEV